MGFIIISLVVIAIGYILAKVFEESIFEIVAFIFVVVGAVTLVICLCCAIMAPNDAETLKMKYKQDSTFIENASHNAALTESERLSAVTTAISWNTKIQKYKYYRHTFLYFGLYENIEDLTLFSLDSIKPAKNSLSVDMKDKCDTIKKK